VSSKRKPRPKERKKIAHNGNKCHAAERQRRDPLHADDPACNIQSFRSTLASALHPEVLSSRGRVGTDDAGCIAAGWWRRVGGVGNTAVWRDARTEGGAVKSSTSGREEGAGITV
jgi:hypothetical protein